MTNGSLAEAADRTFLCCGVHIAGVEPIEAVEKCLGLPAHSSVHLCNAYTLSLATSDRAYLELLNKSSLNLPDGTPVAWVGRALGKKASRAPVRGPEFMLSVMESGLMTGQTHFLFGGTDELLAQLHDRLVALMPGLRIVGRLAPPFAPWDPTAEEALLSRLNSTRPRFVWVALGTPKQDVAVNRMAAQYPGVFCAVGAAFDFAAGTKQEAPVWLRSTGLEWLHRFIQEPRRLWRRYLFGNLKFLYGLIRR